MLKYSLGCRVNVKLVLVTITPAGVEIKMTPHFEVWDETDLYCPDVACGGWYMATACVGVKAGENMDHQPFLLPRQSELSAVVVSKVQWNTCVWGRHNMPRFPSSYKKGSGGSDRHSIMITIIVVSLAYIHCTAKASSNDFQPALSCVS